MGNQYPPAKKLRIEQPAQLAMGNYCSSSPETSVSTPPIPGTAPALQPVYRHTQCPMSSGQPVYDQPVYGQPVEPVRGQQSVHCFDHILKDFVAQNTFKTDDFGPPPPFHSNQSPLAFDPLQFPKREDSHRESSMKMFKEFDDCYSGSVR